MWYKYCIEIEEFLISSSKSNTLQNIHNQWVSTTTCPNYMFHKLQNNKDKHLTTIIDLCQSLYNVQLNMHNIYVISSHLCSIDGLIFLQDITIQDIHKANFKFFLLEMVITISNITWTKTNKRIVYWNPTIELQ